MINYSLPDLTQHPPRSLRVRLGGYVHLPRLLDKARAVIAGKGGEYHYNCPIDQLFFAFTGIAPEALLAEVKTGKSDLQMLEWVNGNTNRTPFEVVNWSLWLEARGPGSQDGHTWIAETLKGRGSLRDDIRSITDLLDLDDYLTFGGKA